MTVHFIHTSDWHLGFYQYNKPERFGDYYAAVNKLIDRVIEIDPQFVLHSGDLFHHARPTPATIRQAVGILRRLDKADIPMYVVRGNHDGKDSVYLRRGGGIISLLKDFDLVKYLNDSIITLPKLECKIMGVGYYPGNKVTKKIEQLLQEDPDFLETDDFTIISIHAFVEGQLDDIAQISLKRISELGVDYLGAGHYHIPWQDPKRDVYVPGSTECTSINDIQRDDMIEGVAMYSSFLEVKAKRSENWEMEVMTHKIPVRAKISIEHHTSKTSVEDIHQELDNLIDDKIEIILKHEPQILELAPILSIKLKTKLHFEDYSQIYIEDWYEDQFLHIVSEIDGKLNVASISQDLGTSHHREEILAELIDNYDLEEETYLPILIDLLDQFGQTPPGRELGSDIYNNITKLLSEIAGNGATDYKQGLEQTQETQGLDVLYFEG